ncbi:M20 family metallo-hydrolase [Alteribacter populi]|uniref:M20 family metallo-hydrolase n=1 Tax=Alteribacter populi TaxID=2011011 RepID=UPI000BBA7A65|nr:M20 family metallo-hydrolase [Alteribacter populi]
MKSWLSHTLNRLNLVESMDQPEGFTRLSYTKEEWESMGVFKTVAEELGLRVRQDQAGNVIARFEPEDFSYDKAAVVVGSHLDTVANGGGYDGVAGVLCGLASVKQLINEGFQPKRPIEVICFASEESARFGVSTIGSKAMTGLLDPAAVEHISDVNGVTIKEAVESRGLRWSEVTKAERSREEIHSFLELHIEQGTRVENAKADYGAVTAIACPIRLILHIEGNAGHTGTTPMDRRQDALVAAARIIHYISERAERLSQKGDYPVVATASTIELKPNVMNVIPGVVELGVDIRSVDDALKEKLEDDIYTECSQVEARYKVSIQSEKLVHNPSITLDPTVHEVLTEVGKKEGYTPFTLESGAGHDVMNTAVKWPSGLLFIPCKDGLSHHPKEAASLEDLEKGVHVMTAYLRKETGD